MPRSLWRFACLALIISATPAQAAAPPTSAGLRFFEMRVRPLLAERCWDCHSGDEVESELRLDSLKGMSRGGTRGPAIVIGKPAESLIVHALRHSEHLQMPPKEKLPPRDIADITKWIQMGAPWPDAKATNAASIDAATHPDQFGQEFTADEKNFWAFRPPVAPPLPQVDRPDWVTSPIDTFILARLAAHNLEPAPAADKISLIRRATFDLIGLPPTPVEVDAFLADHSPDAFAEVVERLLNSPRYGERWGRHWLDVARYADSNGLDENLAYANAFRYRDYVVNAFNSNKPYDRFVQEQLAGDLLPGVHQDSDRHHDAAALEALVATGFLSLGAKMLAEDDPVKMQMDIIDEQIDTIGRTFIGLTLGCARCHDHKFDPIPTADYYSLAGIFKSTRTMENFKVVARWQERPLAQPAALRKQQEHQRRVATNQADIDRLTEQAQQTVLDEAKQHVGDYMLAAAALQRQRELLTEATVFGNKSDANSTAGLMVLEAEDYDRGNVLKDHSNYGRGIGVLVNQGELPNFVEYDLDLPTSGWYQLESRYAAESARPCKLSINGQRVKSDAAGRATGGWFPASQQWHVEGFYECRQGPNVLRLEHPQHFPHIDKLLLVPATVDLPSWERLSPEYKLIPAFVEQWSRYLELADKEAAPLFATWHAYLLGSEIDSLQGAAADVRDALCATSTPDSIIQLAERYQDRFARAARGTEDAEDTFHDELRRVLDDANGPFAHPPELEINYPPAVASRLTELREEKKALEESAPKLPEAMVVSDEAQPQNVRIHIRGSHLTRGAEVPRRFPRIVAGDDQPFIGDDRSGRLELALWLTNPRHPLTARVMVNRIWQWHFGTGLVRTPDNFGRLGERPTHPQLLDWLATQFVESGWSIKAMHRLIMLSATYQMSSAGSSRAAEIDPENRWYARINKQRLDAEAIRDAILAVSGQLDGRMRGTQLQTPNRNYVTSTANVNPVVYQSPRRSIYLPIVRSALYDVFQAFDFPDPSVPNGQRQITTVAPQALFMMNSQFVADQAEAFAQSLLSDVAADNMTRVETAYRLAYSRLPTPEEAATALAYLEDYAEALGARETTKEKRQQRAWQSLCRAIISANEFVYLE